MPRNKQFKEEEALEKALNLFWDKGYHSTSMQELVTTMGISRASLYDTYGDKRQLFEKAFSEYTSRNAQTLEVLFNQSTNIKKTFEDLFEQNINDIISDSRKKGCFAVNTAAECTPEDVDFLVLLEGNNQAMLHIFEQALKRAQNQGQIHPKTDTANTAYMLYTLLNGIRVLGKVNPDIQKMHASVKAALQLLN